MKTLFKPAESNKHKYSEDEKKQSNEGQHLEKPHRKSPCDFLFKWVRKSEDDYGKQKVEAEEKDVPGFSCIIS